MFVSYLHWNNRFHLALNKCKMVRIFGDLLTTNSIFQHFEVSGRLLEMKLDHLDFSSSENGLPFIPLENRQLQDPIDEETVVNVFDAEKQQRGFKVLY